jgi:FtsP/CotA-like multicopper oxidase with cupredoxin domain
VQRRLLLALALLGLAAAAYSGMGATPGPTQLREFTLEVTAAACPYKAQGEWLCLAYNGQIPGPMLDVDLGDTISITLVNKIAETIWQTNASDLTKARLANASVSWHVHGTAVPNEMDGIDAHPGTSLLRSVAEPGGSFVYVTRAAFAGAWHYHDHVLGFDGAEGVARGLYGGLVVRNGAQLRPETSLDLHLLDSGANGGRGLDASVAQGTSFEILLVGLENFVRTVELRHPGGAIEKKTVGPGMSDRFVVAEAQAGDYVWRAVGFDIKTGRVSVA